VESRSSWPPEAVMFVICSNTNPPRRLQHFVVPDAEGYAFRTEPLEPDRIGFPVDEQFINSWSTALAELVTNPDAVLPGGP
jgi:hypothetical protein